MRPAHKTTGLFSLLLPVRRWLARCGARAGAFLALLLCAIPGWAQVLPAAPSDLSTYFLSNRIMTFAFTPPFDGGSPILYYTIDCGDGYMGFGSNNFIDVELDNGRSYLCRIAATNAVGTSAFSTPPVLVQLLPGVPGRPGLVKVVQGPAGSGLGEARFSAPPTGGYEIIGYSLTCTPIGGGEAVTVSGTGLVYNLTGLLAGVSYKCAARATNFAGQGPPGATEDAAVTMALAPGAPEPPVARFAIAGNAMAAVSFNPSPSQGDSPITSYHLRCTPPEGPSITATGSASPIVIAGLLNGRPHFCTVQAINVHSSSKPSNGIYITPTADVAGPAAPTNISVAVGGTQASLAFTAPPDGAAGYVGVCEPGGHAALADRSPVTITGLAPGSNFSCSVRSHNGVLAGPASAARNITIAGQGAANVQDIWWGGKPENGWGLNIAQSGNLLVAGWYIFGADGKPAYIIMQGGSWNAGLTTFTGPVIRPVSGAPYYAYDPTLFVPGPTAGSLSVTFSGASEGVMTYTLNGITGFKPISRLKFAEGAISNTYAGIWWGGPEQNGWGIAIPPQQGDTLVGAWFTFDEDGRPIWYVLNSNDISTGRFDGQIITGFGAPTIAPTYDPLKYNPFHVGGFILNFTDANNGTFTYGSNDSRQTKVIRRMTF